MDRPKLIIIECYAYRHEAELAKGALELAGIPSMIQSDTLGGMRDHLAWSGLGFKLLVREEDETPARDVLNPPADHIESSESDSPPNQDATDPDSRPRLRRTA